MTRYLKDGTPLPYKVEVEPDGKTQPLYSHSYPKLNGTKVIKGWTTKVRPIKDLTKFLQGCNLKKNEHYIVGYDKIAKMYQYWFVNDNDAMLFKLRCGHLKQTLTEEGPKFKTQCTNCGHITERKDINWTL